LVYISYLLAKNPEWFDKLAEELSGYTDVDSLQSSELEKLPLLNAVIRETLRLYPPAASPVFSRVVPEGGATLAGHIIPAGVYPLYSVC
jgi:cytochrome P450